MKVHWLIPVALATSLYGCSSEDSSASSMATGGDAGESAGGGVAGGNAGESSLAGIGGMAAGSAGESSMAGAGGSTAGAGGAGDVPPAVDRDETLEIVRRVADYYLEQFADDVGQNVVYDWIRGTFYTGLMAAYRTTEDTKYRDAALSWATDAGFEPWPNNNGDRFADNQTCAQTYGELYLDDPTPQNEFMLAPVSAVFDQMVAAPRPGRDEWWWCDALFMAPPAMARYAEATGNTQYRDLMHTMWWDTKEFLYNEATQLFWRDGDYVDTNIHWARGNGWVFGGTARVLEYLPENDPQRPNYESLFGDMAEALLAAQADDGFWRSNLLDPDQFSNPESSGTAFFTFGMAWGVHHGLLDRDTYLPAVLSGWDALSTVALNQQGRIGWVQAVGKEPGPATEGSTNDYAAGAFLLAASEVIEL